MSNTKVNKRNLGKVWTNLDKATNHLYEALEQLREIGLTEDEGISLQMKYIDIYSITALKNQIEMKKDEM